MQWVYAFLKLSLMFAFWPIIGSEYELAFLDLPMEMGLLQASGVILSGLINA